jgi:hypothetical protein
VVEHLPSKYKAQSSNPRKEEEEGKEKSLELDHIIAEIPDSGLREREIN